MVGVHAQGQPAPPVAGGEPGSGLGGGTVTITQREYELLLLRDRAISVLAEGMTIADCSHPDMPLM